MQHILGLRCWADAFGYAVVSGTQSAPNLIVAKHVALPAGAIRAEQLASFRDDIFAILSNYSIAKTYFRATETIARTKTLSRAELEGVLQEACYSHDPRIPIEKRIVSQLKKALGYNGSASSVFSLFDIPAFEGLSKVHLSEAAVTALAGLD